MRGECACSTIYAPVSAKIVFMLGLASSLDGACGIRDFEATISRITLHFIRTTNVNATAQCAILTMEFTIKKSVRRNAIAVPPDVKRITSSKIFA